jgi:hypothetical protein
MTTSMGTTTSGEYAPDEAPLPSWYEGSTKGSIIRLVRRATTAGDQQFVKPVERIALSHRLLLLLLAMLVVVITPAIAQQPPPPPAAPDPKVVTPKDANSDPAVTKTDEAVGKSKLEKETGTKNDRIFDVLPNYGFVAGDKPLPPLTSGQKFRLATASVFDWAAFPFNGALAGIAQAKNDPDAWGQGWDAYAKRYGESFADNSIGTYMTTAIFPSLLHEDPRYYQMRQGKFSSRAYYSMNRLFVTRTDSGSTRFNYSESIGNAAAAAISNIYHPEEDRTAERNAKTFGFLILYDGLANELKEFWPDIRRKVLHKDTAP